MKSKAVLNALRYLGVTVAFAVCGVLSARYCLEDSFPVQSTGGYYLLGFPFALLCTILFIRTPNTEGLGNKASRITVVIIFMGLTWIVSVRVAPLASILPMKVPFLPFTLLDLWPAWFGGLVGGLGLTLSAAIGCERLFSPRYLIAGGVIGWLSASPIGIWMTTKSDMFREIITPLSWINYHHLYYAFGIWQAAMGVYLYGISTNAKMKTQAVKIAVG
jgi:hypothetical protein